jgi:hypothetical protein
MGLRPTQGDKNRSQARSELVIPSEAEDLLLFVISYDVFSTEHSPGICLIRKCSIGPLELIGRTRGSFNLRHCPAM